MLLKNEKDTFQIPYIFNNKIIHKHICSLQVFLYQKPIIKLAYLYRILYCEKLILKDTPWIYLYNAFVYFTIL